MSQTVLFYKRNYPVQNCMELKIAIKMKKNCQACNWSLLIGRAYKKIILERVFSLFYTDFFQSKNGLCFKKYILTVISVPEFHRLYTFNGL